MEFVVQALGSLWLFTTPWTIAHQAPLFSTVFWSLLKFMSIELVMLPNHLILCPFSFCLLIRVFSNKLALCVRGPKYWNFSFSISLFNEFQGWFPSPAPQCESISSSALSLLYGPTLTFVHDYWENHSFGYANLYWQSDVSAFYYTVFQM